MTPIIIVCDKSTLSRCQSRQLCLRLRRSPLGLMSPMSLQNLQLAWVPKKASTYVKHEINLMFVILLSLI